jgi:PKD repeat protein
MVVAEAPPTLLRYPQSGLPNQAPTAQASASVTGGRAPLTVAFSAAGSTDADGRIATYAWTFGDGQTSTLANPTHTYAAGTWSAQLTVTDTLGLRSLAAPLIVSAGAPAPARPRSLDVAAVSVVSGGRTVATVTVSSASGVTLLLSSSNPAAATVPAQLVIPPGATRGSFTVATRSVRQDARVTIRASANGGTTSDVLTVRKR